MNSSPTDITIPPYVKKALDGLNSGDFEAYIVGGCVRDALLGKEPYDYDITTSALPEETEKCFPDRHIIETGIKHGTVTVRIDGESLEITTFRTDGGYTDHRHPQEVFFSRKLTNDLSRRDFTVNAMCFSPQSGLVDVFRGKDDLENKIIRCVGDPEKRFDEDALRILRGIRFAATLGFSVEEKTAEAMHGRKELLKSISAERINAELRKTLTNLKNADILIQFRDVLETVLPQLKEISGDEYSDACERVKLTDDMAVSLALFLCPLSQDSVRSVFSSLKSDRKTKEYVLFLCGQRNTGFASAGDVLALIGKSGVEYLEGLIKFRQLENEAGISIITEALSLVEKGTPVRTDELALSGGEIASLGFTGSEIRYISEKLLHAVWYEGLENSKLSLIGYIDAVLR